MTDRRNVPDPIALEVLHNALLSITEEAYVALMKSAYSTNIKERHDHSVMLTDPAGRLVAQPGQSLPVHLSSMLGLIEAVLKKYPTAAIEEGDIFVGNDPFVAGGTRCSSMAASSPGSATSPTTPTSAAWRPAGSPA